MRLQLIASCAHDPQLLAESESEFKAIDLKSRTFSGPTVILFRCLCEHSLNVCQPLICPLYYVASWKQQQHGPRTHEKTSEYRMFWKLSGVGNRDGPMFKHNSDTYTFTSILNPLKWQQEPRKHWYYIKDNLPLAFSGIIVIT